MLGGPRSLHLQALHPRTVAGVSQNSTYRSAMWGRLVRTSDHVATVIYSGTTEAQQASAELRRLHARLTRRSAASLLPARRP